MKYSKKMNHIIAILLITLIFAGCQAETPMQESPEDGLEPDKVFMVTGENYKFMMDGIEAPELKVNVGDRVKIKFTSTEGFHDWVVDEFSAATEKVREGESTSVEFIADKAGTFEYYCSVGSHRANGMFGNLIVSDIVASEAIEDHMGCQENEISEDLILVLFNFQL